MKNCFACGKKLGKNPCVVDTRDSQFVFVGSECYKEIKRAGETGYQPPLGGPRLWVGRKGQSQAELFSNWKNALSNSQLHPVFRDILNNI